MNRREFLKGVAAFAAMPLIPKTSTIGVFDNIQQISVGRPFSIAQGMIVSAGTRGHQYKILELGFIVSKHEVENIENIFINDHKIDFDSDNIAIGYYDGLIKKGELFHHHYGGQSFSGMNLEFEYDENKFPDGIPRISFGT